MRILITGAHGMLGRELQTVLAGRTITAAGRGDLDITDADAVEAAVAAHDVVINAAAYTAVDAAETNEDLATAVNGLGAGNLARAARHSGARLIHISTDYVFDGQATSPIPEDAPLTPLNAYGRSKAEGERLVRDHHPDGSIIVRTAWLYGQHGPNFVATMLRLARGTDTLRVVDDQFGAPTWARDVAAGIRTLVDSDVTHGTFHAVGAGRTTWWEFAGHILSHAGEDPDRVIAVSSHEYPRPAQRPAWSILSTDEWARHGLTPLRHWRDAFTEAVAAGLLTDSE